jgi:hypothetical protein
MKAASQYGYSNRRIFRPGEVSGGFTMKSGQEIGALGGPG